MACIHGSMSQDKSHNPFESSSAPKIETIRTPGGHEISFSPERGGIITSLKIGGKELLYMDEATFRDTSVSVKGGIPIMFPNAGPIKSSDFPGLKQHGYARSSSAWEIGTAEGDNFFSESLKANDDTMRTYPYNVELRIRGEIGKDSSISLRQEVINYESDKEVPVSMGLHPYFRVPSDEKKNIKFDFAGGDMIEAAVDQWANGDFISVDNPKVNDPDAVLRVVLPSVGTLIIDVSKEYKKIWVWSLPDKDFVCVEPVMRKAGGLVDDPEKIAPGDVLSAKINIRLENSA